MKSIVARQLLILAVLLLPSAVCAQNITEIAQSDPLIITGAVGTQNTYHYSSVGDGYASPLSNSLYASMNISLYGFSMPFAFYYTNDNTSFSYPHFSFNLTPQYKNWTGHFGQSSMAMSSYVMNMSFNGVGVEYESDRFRAGAFYGQLRKAINDDPTDPAARRPQFRRMAWGMKVGYGSHSNYIDLYMLRAYDCLNTVNEAWRDINSPQENIVVGLKGCTTPLKWMSLTANVATSLFSTDTQAEKVPSSEAARWDKVFDIRYSSLARIAGDAALNLTLPFGVNASVCYRLIQPDYTSLGTYYMSNNYQSLGIMASTTLFKKVNLSATYSGQNDNLTNKQLYTTSGYIYNAMASTRIGNHFNLAASYNGYTQRQSDGTAIVNDSIRVNRQMSSFSFTPSYMIDGETLSHTISLSANLTENKDRNKITEAIQHSNVSTRALGASYTMGIKPWDTDVVLSYSHQKTKGYRTRYRSEVGSITASRAFLTEKNLDASATLLMCYNDVYRQSKSLSLGCDFSLGYTLKKVHTFSADAAFNKFGDVNISQVRSNLDCLDISCSLNYAYTFTLLELKRKNSPKL